MQTLCALFGKSRQAWYDEQKRQDKEALQTALVLAEVKRLRMNLPSIGVDVLHYQLTDFRQQHGIKIGRDKLANLLRNNGLLVIKRSRRVKTTWSHHHYFKYPNLTISKHIRAPNCLWVSDITYILIGRGFGYLSLVTDAYSRKIVGWYLAESLQASGSVAALKMALKTNKGRLNPELIHHSDRGVQYCCRDYIDLLDQAKIAISMTQSGDPYENALAERVNRTIKEDMLLNRGFATFEVAQAAVSRAIESYNKLRPHSSCNYLTPEQAHQLEGPLKKRWGKSQAEDKEKVLLQEVILVTQNRP
jgi:transposase InsO family protein